MATTLHITRKGHKCKHNLTVPPASCIKNGERLAFKGLELTYNNRQRAYNVHSDVAAWGRHDSYQFNNYNCAVAFLSKGAAQFNELTEAGQL